MRVIVNEGGSVDWKKEIYLPGSPIDLPEKEAQRLIDKGKVSPEEDGLIAETLAPDKMTVAQLKELLEKLEIEIPSDAKKADLVDLVLENTGEPVAED